MSAGKAAIFGNASQRHMLCSVMDACCSPYMIYEGASFLFGVATVTVDQHLEQTRCRCCFAPFTHNICVISIPVHYTLYIVVGCACVAVYGGTSGGRFRNASTCRVRITLIHGNNIVFAFSIEAYMYCLMLDGKKTNCTLGDLEEFSLLALLLWCISCHYSNSRGCCCCCSTIPRTHFFFLATSNKFAIDEDV